VAGESWANVGGALVPPAAPHDARAVLAAILSTCVSAVFAAFVAAQYRRRRQPYQEAWAIGLAMFAIAAAAGVFARAGGATETEYRLFYLFGAILNVAWLALGTLYVTVRRPIADASLVFVYAFSVVSAIVVFTSPVDLSAALDTGRGFQDSPLPRLLAGIGSGIGSVVLIGGALLSAWSFLRKRRNGRRALANAVIAAGVLIVAAGGTAAFTGASGVVELTNLVGVAVMFVGFRLIG
jgi:uncharacterized membrane protein HdeD (DUF308 family)